MPSGANCKAGVCECVDGHTYVRGRCRPLNGLGQTCETDLDCYFGYDRQSVICRNQLCECANGYYQRYGNICRRKSMAINDPCVVDTDCSTLGNDIKCLKLACQSAGALQRQTTQSSITTTEEAVTTRSASVVAVANGGDSDEQSEQEPNSQSEHTRKSREIAVQTSLELLELKPLTNLRNVPVNTNHNNEQRLQYHYHNNHPVRHDDEDKTLSTASNLDDDTEDKKYGGTCSDNGKACHGLPHSSCVGNICICKQGYYNKNGKCFAELGEIAESVEECEFTFDDLTRKCICQKNYYYERNLRACKKPIKHELSCTSNSQCSPFGVSFCSPVIPRRCVCAKYTEFDVAQQLCVNKKGLGAECDTNDTCPVHYSLCLNRVCTCKTHYSENNGACIPSVGTNCKDDRECLQENSICEVAESDTEKTCQCRKGFVHFNDQCLKEADDIGDECTESEQCKPLLATCSTDNKCSCKPGQHFKNGRCENKKGLGEACNRAGECFLDKQEENIECRNSVCQCKFGHKADVEQRSCIRVAPNKKNSSGRPSALKIITFLLIGSAFLITSAALKQAYF